MLAGSLTQVPRACDKQRVFFEHALIDKVETSTKDMPT